VGNDDDDDDVITQQTWWDKREIFTWVEGQCTVHGQCLLARCHCHD